MRAFCAAIFSVFLTGLSWPLAAASAPPRIGYGSSTAVISASYQENVYLGFELGFEKTLGEKRARHLLKVRQLTDRSMAGATVSAESLVADGVVALVGFPVSHDALLAADVARKHGMLGLFAGASHSDLGHKGPLIYSTGASMGESIDSLLAFLQKTFRGKRGLALISPYAAFSINQEEVLTNRMHLGKFPQLHLETRHLTKALVLKEEDLRGIKEGAFDFLYLTLYPDELIALITQLLTAKVDLPMVGWSAADPDVLRRSIAGMKSPFYIGTSWVRDSPESRAFERLVHKRYHIAANTEMALGFDLGIILATVVKHVPGALTKESIVKAFHKTGCFSGLLSGKSCFGKNGGHATRGLQFARFTEVGTFPPKARQ